MGMLVLYVSYPCAGPTDSTVLRAPAWFLSVDFRFMDEYGTEDCLDFESEEVARLVLLTIVVFLVSLALILAFICRFK